MRTRALPLPQLTLERSSDKQTGPLVRPPPRPAPPDRFVAAKKGFKLPSLFGVNPVRLFSTIRLPSGSGHGVRGVVHSGGKNPDWVDRSHKMLGPLVSNHTVTGDDVKSGVARMLRNVGAKKLRDVHFFGHGGAGKMWVGDETITKASFDPKHPHYPHLVRLRDRMTKGGVVHFAGCETFKGPQGRAFAKAAAKFFNREVVGYTAVIPPWTSRVAYRP